MRRFGLFSRSKAGSKFGYSALHDEDIDVAALVAAKGSAALKNDHDVENDSRDGGDTNSISNNPSDNGRDRDRDDGVAGAGGALAGGDNDGGGGAADSAESDETAVDDDSVSESEGYAPVSMSRTDLLRNSLRYFPPKSNRFVNLS